MKPALAREVDVHRAIGLQPLQLLPQVVGLRYDVDQYLSRYRFFLGRRLREAAADPTVVAPSAAESARVERVCAFILRCLDEAQYALAGARITYPRALQLAAQAGRAQPPPGPGVSPHPAGAAARQRFLTRWLGRKAAAIGFEPDASLAEALVVSTTICLWVARRLVALVLSSQGERHDDQFAAPYREDFHFYHPGTVYGNARTLRQALPAREAEEAFTSP
ncbi:MAG TPA: hypothetical protein VFB73_04830 [Chloroflexota bacterium]|nr:hypothetical protein [Chloroflexota bacterium]